MPKIAAAPSIGWFMLSEADRSAANRYLTKLASDGTRDELGFAPIHFAFADRFFPGTSVQHAQLRYVFFVAWAYDEILKATGGERFSRDTLLEIEERYSLRLMNSVESLSNSGISGWMKYLADQRPVVRASTIYWTALRSWRLAGPVAGLSEAPTEGQLQGLWPRLLTREDGDEGRSSTAVLFDGLPLPPDNWRKKTGQLDLALRREEADYLRKKWSAAGKEGKPPLMSRLAEAGVTTQSLWSRSVRRVALQSEHRALDLAERAASLACIARAAHSALIEAERNIDRGLDLTAHQEALPGLISIHRDTALALDLKALCQETAIDSRLERFIEAILKWVRNKDPLAAIKPVISAREFDLKGGRAYLANKKRRDDWRKDQATPLDYRWPVVRNMISRVLEAT